MEIHKMGEGEEIKKLPLDPKIAKATIATRAKALVAAIVAKLKK